MPKFYSRGIFHGKIPGTQSSEFWKNSRGPIILAYSAGLIRTYDLRRPSDSINHVLIKL